MSVNPVCCICGASLRGEEFYVVEAGTYIHADLCLHLPEANHLYERLRADGSLEPSDIKE